VQPSEQPPLDYLTHDRLMEVGLVRLERRKNRQGRSCTYSKLAGAKRLRKGSLILPITVLRIERQDRLLDRRRHFEPITGAPYCLPVLVDTATVASAVATTSYLWLVRMQ
jgi:hypothetical protein